MLWLTLKHIELLKANSRRKIYFSYLSPFPSFSLSYKCWVNFQTKPGEFKFQISVVSIKIRPSRPFILWETHSYILWFGSLFFTVTLSFLLMSRIESRW